MSMCLGSILICDVDVDPVHSELFDEVHEQEVLLDPFRLSGLVFNTIILCQFHLQIKVWSKYLNLNASNEVKDSI